MSKMKVLRRALMVVCLAVCLGGLGALRTNGKVEAAAAVVGPETMITSEVNVASKTANSTTLKDSDAVNGVRVLGSTTSYSFEYVETMDISTFTYDMNLFQIQVDSLPDWSKNHVTKLTMKLVDSEDATKYVGTQFVNGCWTYPNNEEGEGGRTRDNAATDAHGCLVYSDGTTSASVSWTGEAGKTTCCNGYSLARSALWDKNAPTIAYDYETTTLWAKNTNDGRSFVYDISTIITSGKAILRVEVETNNIEAGVIVGMLGGQSLSGKALISPDMVLASENNVASKTVNSTTLKDLDKVNGIRVLGNTTSYAFEYFEALDITTFTSDMNLFQIQVDALPDWSKSHVTKLTMKLVDSEDPTKYVGASIINGCWTYPNNEDGEGGRTRDNAATDAHGTLVYCDGTNAEVSMDWEGNVNKNTHGLPYSVARSALWDKNAPTIAYDYATKTIMAKGGTEVSQQYVVDISPILTSGKAILRVEVETNNVEAGVIVGTLGGVDLSGELISAPANLQLKGTVTFMADGEEVAVKEYTLGDESVEEPAVPEKEGFDGRWESYSLNGNVIVNAIYVPDETIVNLSNMASQTLLQNGIKVNTEVEPVVGTRVLGSATNFSFASQYAVKLEDLTYATDLFRIKTDVDSAKHVNKITLKLVDAADPTKVVSVEYSGGCWVYMQDQNGNYTVDDGRTDSHAFLYAGGEEKAWNVVPEDATSWPDHCCSWNSIAHGRLWGMAPITIAYDAETTVLSLKRAHGGKDRAATIDLASYLTSGWAYLEVDVETNDTSIGVVVDTLGGIQFDGTTTALPTENYQHKVTFMADGEEVAVKNYVYGTTSVEAPEVPAKEGHTGVWEEYTINRSDIVVNAMYTPEVYDLTVRYVYEDGSEAAATYTTTVTYKQTYSVESPAITGYTVDVELVEGLMLADREITVTYTAIKPVLTINYVYENGGEAATTYTQEYAYGADYAVDSPAIEGYTVDVAKVEGTNLTEDKTVTVTYTAIKLVLTINYVYANGGEAATTYTQEYAYGADYAVDSPAIEGYTVDVAKVEGTNLTEDKTVTVTYTAIVVEPPVDSNDSTDTNDSTESADSITESKDSDSGIDGCFSSIGPAPVFALLAVAGVAVVAKKRRD